MKAVIKIKTEKFQEMTNHRFKNLNNPKKDK